MQYTRRSLSWSSSLLIGVVAGLCGAAIVLLFGSLFIGNYHKPGYSNDQKAKIAALVQPEAAKLASEILKHNPKNVTTSTDGKFFLVSQWNTSVPGYSAEVEIAKTGASPDPSQVTTISLYRWATDVTPDKATTIDYSITLDANGNDHGDQYWSVDSLLELAPGSTTKADRIFVSNLPGDKFETTMDSTKSIMDTVKHEFEPALLHAK